jgi:riboflavin kinase/FMN adenylyltransferase
MTLLHGFERPQSYRGGYVAIGNFDGVHRGHQQMTSLLADRARAAGVPAVALTFDPHPVELLRPGQVPPRLSTIEWKAELLTRYGADVVIAYPTDRALLNLSPREFFDRIVLDRLDARGLVEGPNFFFGHNRAGDVRTLAQLCEAAGRTLDIVEPVRVGGDLVSSSRVRALVESGQMSEAVELLGHPYRITGLVAHGDERGRELGWPTANLADVPTLLPADGVYAAIGHTGDDHCDRGRFPAAVHVGPNATFGQSDRRVEVHLIGFDGDLYGQRLSVDFLARIRGTQKFDSADALRVQLDQDVQTAAAMARDHTAR